MPISSSQWLRNNLIFSRLLWKRPSLFKPKMFSMFSSGFLLFQIYYRINYSFDFETNLYLCLFFIYVPVFVVELIRSNSNFSLSLSFFSLQLFSLSTFLIWKLIILIIMFGYLLGKKDSQEKKVQRDITSIFNTKLKGQFCEICQKNTATKASFGKQVKAMFTCASCQIQAVGGNVRLLGKNLMTTDRFSEELTNLKTPPVQHKKTQQTCESLQKKVAQLNKKIGDEFKKMKNSLQKKHAQLLQESQKQNTILIFEDVSKIIREKRFSELDNGRIILKRSMVNNKGLTFTDEMAIQTANNGIAQKFTELKKESKIRLKPLEDLIDEINGLEL